MPGPSFLLAYGVPAGLIDAEPDHDPVNLCVGPAAPFWSPYLGRIQFFSYLPGGLARFHEYGKYASVFFRPVLGLVPLVAVVGPDIGIAYLPSTLLGECHAHLDPLRYGFPFQFSTDSEGVYQYLGGYILVSIDHDSLFYNVKAYAFLFKGMSDVVYFPHGAGQPG